MISFIVPAHNEAACLAPTVQAIHNAARNLNQPYEIVVADDASTDATAEIARQNNSRVISVNHRQIAATRNSGARATCGDRLFFVDADTIINPAVVVSALRLMDKGAVGGGALARFDRLAPLYAHVMLLWFGLFLRLAGIVGGACMFCTRDAFERIGGFDERLFGAEDAAMSWALNRQGRFVVLWRHVLTSSRRMRGLNGPRILASLFRMGFNPKMLTRRSSVQNIWYDSDRERDQNFGTPVATRLFNFLMLVFTVLTITPVFAFVPWSLTPRDSPIGKFRIGVAIIACHVAMVLWPCACFLFVNILKQKRWLERLKSSALIAASLWCAWGATPVVFWFWKDLFLRLVNFNSG
jgi:glycosyltransferase involved in cell wall biosynthesis